MICSDNSRCKKFNVIEVDMFICRNCNAISNNPFKIVINCCKKNSLIKNQIFHFAKTVKDLFMYE